MEKTSKASSTNLDVLIIGAGISGINAAYRVQEGLPDYSYAVLESRHEIGGTWSLFKYPGIRSDSDLYTFGFAFDPWTEGNAIAPAPSILNYLKGVSKRHGIDSHIRFHHKVLALDWKSDQQKWRVDVQVGDDEQKIFWSRFVIMSTGYYDYNEGLKSEISGLENFSGQVVHPQFWPEDLDYTNKQVVIIGSGATAVTILPAMQQTGAGHVTMLQRSPGYFINLPTVDPVNTFFRRWFPSHVAHRIIRLRILIMTYIFFYYCHYFPKHAIGLIRRNTEKELPPNIPVDPHFVPRYRPWQQRMCVTPNGDFFQALRTGKADIATGKIKTVTRDGITLESGQTLKADIIITATGLKVAMCGNATLAVDGRQICIGDLYIWRGSMLDSVPNLAFFMGYTNASWTLGSDATARLFVRLLKDMQTRSQTSVTATVEENSTMQPEDMMNLNSGYIQAAVKMKQFPKCGNQAPWKPRRNYFIDSWFASYGDIEKGLVFDTVSTK